MHPPPAAAAASSSSSCCCCYRCCLTATETPRPSPSLSCLLPTSLLMSADLPTFGNPTTAHLTDLGLSPLACRLALISLHGQEGVGLLGH